MSLVHEVETLSDEDLREFLMLLRDRLELRGMMGLTETAFREWDNEGDSEYDKLL